MTSDGMEEGPDNLGITLIALMKGIVTREHDPSTWQHLGELSSRIRDYLSIIGLDLVLDESEGYAFLKQQTLQEGETDLPRLIPRRKLGYQVSLLLVLLRKKLAENDAAGLDTRLIVTRHEIVEMVRLFLPDTANEARLEDQVEGQINKIIDMGFLRKLRGNDNTYEVHRIIKAFVDAQWLDDFQEKLAEYAGIARDSSQEKPS